MTETALCAVHTTQQAFATCARCGNYACAYCLGDRDVCAACVARDLGDVVPWERKDLPVYARFWRTTREVITQPSRFFGELRSTSTGAALTYAALVPLLLVGVVVLPLGLCGFAAFAAAARSRVGAGEAAILLVIAVGLPLAAPAFTLVGTLLRSVVFHVAAKAAGGRGTFDVSLRACAYMAAFLYVSALANVLGIVPFCGPFLVLGVFLVDLAWSGFVLTVVARERHGLAGARAALAGWLPSALLGLVLLAFFALGLVSALAGSAPDAYQ